LCPPPAHALGSGTTRLSPSPYTPPPDPAPPAARRERGRASTGVGGEPPRRQPDGPSYEFFKDLLPPVRYVNTAFRHYPIVLSAPAAPVKARWVSNGGAVNARADKKPMWRGGRLPGPLLPRHPAQPPAPAPAEPHA